MGSRRASRVVTLEDRSPAVPGSPPEGGAGTEAEAPAGGGSADALYLRRRAWEKEQAAYVARQKARTEDASRQP